ncbi:Tetratricopeptide repeat [Phytophthora infestans]|uniref:Tetratricopeptide repeat n=1 Tax=Phytophthora infestans TaxID=4787 RepID=A0A833WI78_PHYIN|nr:Tetratricopeptide repeat [Phytophthora infestans]
MHDKALRDAREEQQQLEALHRLDEECVHQQRAGDYLKAFDCMERALVLRRHFFGIESEEVVQACRALAEMCNLLAMSFLQQDNYPVTVDLLKKAEVLTQRHHPVERATTLNNFACYYRRLGKLHSAMTSLKHALDVEKKLKNVRNAADTQLNMCAVLSQLGKHQEALGHAQDALITLQEGFIHGKHDASADNSAGDSSSARLDRISVMCIAYHNIGVEQEFLKDYSESAASYKKGISLAEQYLGADHSITTTIRNSYLAAKRVLATKGKVKTSASNRDPKSPIAGARLLSSPRSDSLRMPSPLAKGKDLHNGFPTPRSIITDALSRAPLLALPPLELQSPPTGCASKTKKSTVSLPSEVKSTLSPTDPFFSPRFRFDSDTAQQKPLKSVTKPPSAAPTKKNKVGVRTSSSHSGRRKSSVKKPPSRTETSRSDRKKSVDERIKTASTPRATEEDTNAKGIISNCPIDGASGEVGDSSITQDSSEASVADEASGVIQDNSNLRAPSVSIAVTTEAHGHFTADKISSVDHVVDRTVPPSQADCSDDTNRDIADTVLGEDDGEFSKVSTGSIEKITEADLRSSTIDVSPEDINTVVEKQHDAIEDIASGERPDTGIVNNDDSTGSGNGAVNASQNHETPQTNTSEDLVNDKLTVAPDHSEEFCDTAGGEQSHQFIEDDRRDANAEVSVDLSDQGVDEEAMHAGSPADEPIATLEDGNLHCSEETSDDEHPQIYDSEVQGETESTLADEIPGTHNLIEEAWETNPEATTISHAGGEADELSVLSDDQPLLFKSGVGGVDSVTEDGLDVISVNDTDTNEAAVYVLHVEPPSKDHYALIAEDQMNSGFEAQEHFPDQEAKEPQSFDDADEVAATATYQEAHERHLTSDDHLLREEIHPTIETYDAGGATSAEHQPLGQEFVNPSEQVSDSSYQQQGFDDMEIPRASQAQGESVVAEYAAEYGDYSYQDAPVTWQEEQQVCVDYDDSVPTGEASDLPTDIDTSASAVDSE